MALQSRQHNGAVIAVTPAGMDDLNPSNGEMIRLLVDRNSRIEWLLAYDVAAAPYPWVFQGGGPLHAEIAAAGTYNPATANGNWVDLSAGNGPGPDVIAPRDGLYRCVVEAGVACSSAGNFHGVAPQLGAGSAINDLDAAVNYTDRHVSVIRTTLYPLSKGDRVRMMYRSDDSSGTATFTRRVLSIIPMGLS